MNILSIHKLSLYFFGFIKKIKKIYKNQVLLGLT